MPTFRISVINQTFTATNDYDLPSFDDARKHGLKAALSIGSDEVVNGNSYFGAEVLVDEVGGAGFRFVVSVGASSLQ